MRLGWVAASLCLAVSSFVIVGLGAQEPVVEVFKSPT